MQRSSTASQWQLVSRGQLLSLTRAERLDGLYLLLRRDNRWLPLNVSEEQLHCWGGVVASGEVVLPTASLESACRFQLELPSKDLKHAFIRLGNSIWSPSSDQAEPAYRDAPFLLLINRVLCVRHLPAHAIVPLLRQARADDAWERFEMHEPPADALREDPGLGSDAALAAFYLHAGPRKQRLRNDGERLATGLEGEAARDALLAFARRPRDVPAPPAEGNDAGTGAAKSLSPSRSSSSHQPFEFVESRVLDEATGERLAPETVVRGTTRLETLYFRANAPLVNLRRQTTTVMRFALVWKTVKGPETLEMGSYEQRDAPHAFKMPPARIPNNPMARGTFRISVVYTAVNYDNHTTPLLEEGPHEFHIV